ncbi:hypothetical protein ACVKN3_000779 [Luteibacter sp. PvP120]
MLQPSTSPCVDRAALPLDAPAPPIFLLGFVGGLAFGFALGLGPGAWSKSRRVPPSGPRLRRPVNERPLRGRLLIALRAGSGFERGFPIRHPWLSGNGRPSWPAPFGPFPFESLACGYRPRGWHPPALSSTEVGCGESEEPGFASWVGTLACLLCIASVALDTSRVRARACAPTPRRQTTRRISHNRLYPWGRSPRCGRKANKAMTPYPTSARSPPRAARPTIHLGIGKSRRVAPLGPVAAGEGFERTRPRSGAGPDGRPFSLSHGWRIENPRSKPDPARRAINKRPRTRPFIDGSP